MSKFNIKHITRYIYEDMVRDSANQIMLYPIADEYQDILQHTLTITGNPLIKNHTDYFGNKVGTFTHAQPHRELIINSQVMVAVKSRSMPTDTAAADVQWAELEQLKTQMAFIDFTKHEVFEALPEVEKIMKPERRENHTPLQLAKEFSEYIHQNFEYRKGITTVETTIDEIWKLKSGVCQDFAHMLLAMLKLVSIPARYVSGYICPNKNGMRGEGATHAWVEAYVPQYGWLGIDPTNNCLVNETHVRLAVGKNFTDCSPVKGTYRGTSNHTLDVTVSVAYEDGQAHNADTEWVAGGPATTSSSNYTNSFRRYQEMQMQQ